MIVCRFEKNYVLYRLYKLKMIIERDRKRKLVFRYGLEMKWYEREREGEYYR